MRLHGLCTPELKLDIRLANCSQVIWSEAVVERDLNTLPYSNLQVLQAAAVGVDVEKHNLILEDGTKIAYDSLCIAAGAVPKVKLLHLHEIAIIASVTASNKCQPEDESYACDGRGGSLVYFVQQISNWSLM